MDKYNLKAISPIDGRYADITAPLREYFSEFALIKTRLMVEVEYFISLFELKLPQLNDTINFDLLKKIYNDFSIENAIQIKEIEKITNHDVKAVEYFLKEKFDHIGLSGYKEFIHFGLTSQDINNTAIPFLTKQALEKILIPEFKNILSKIEELSQKWKDIPMLARTHGQAATPTTVGKELKVFAYRLEQQLKTLEKINYTAKFGGATGNFNAHLIAYPDINWEKFADDFIKNSFGLQRSQYTTQIDNYDNIAELFECIERINTVLLDFSKDMWTYISFEYFKQKISPDETGSSTMPHKINPVDFENAEGNLEIANALLLFMAVKLPVSRMQRDLSDSTVLRNIGVAVAHTLIAAKSIMKGISKIEICKDKIYSDLDKHWEIIAEAIQTVLRREGFSKPYELLKQFTAGKSEISKNNILSFIENLDVNDKIKEELKKITPFNYTGTASKIH